MNNDTALGMIAVTVFFSMILIAFIVSKSKPVEKTDTCEVSK